MDIHSTCLTSIVSVIHKRDTLKKRNSKKNTLLRLDTHATYGKDYVFALHATSPSGWDWIERTGIRPTTQEDGACGKGIYLTKHAGLCENSSQSPEFTTIQYGSRYKETVDNAKGYKEIWDEKETRVVLVLVMNPNGKSAWHKKEENTQFSDWLVGTETDTLVLKMYKMRTRELAHMAFKYDLTDLAAKTHVKARYCPDDLNRDRGECQADFRSFGESRKDWDGNPVIDNATNIKPSDHKKAIRKKNRKRKRLKRKKNSAGKNVKSAPAKKKEVYEVGAKKMANGCRRIRVAA